MKQNSCRAREEPAEKGESEWIVIHAVDNYSIMFFLMASKIQVQILKTDDNKPICV